VLQVLFIANMRSRALVVIAVILQLLFCGVEVQWWVAGMPTERAVWMVYGGGGDSMFLLGDNAEIEGCGDAL
jgi:hypothetical protein